MGNRFAEAADENNVHDSSKKIFSAGTIDFCEYKNWFDSLQRENDLQPKLYRVGPLGKMTPADPTKLLDGDSSWIQDLGINGNDLKAALDYLSSMADQFITAGIESSFFRAFLRAISAFNVAEGGFNAVNRTIEGDQLGAIIEMVGALGPAAAYALLMGLGFTSAAIAAPFVVALGAAVLLKIHDSNKLDISPEERDAVVEIEKGRIPSLMPQDSNSYSTPDMNVWKFKENIEFNKNGEQVRSVYMMDGNGQIIGPYKIKKESIVVSANTDKQSVLKPKRHNLKSYRQKGGGHSKPSRNIASWAKKMDFNPIKNRSQNKSRASFLSETTGNIQTPHPSEKIEGDVFEKTQKNQVPESIEKLIDYSWIWRGSQEGKAGSGKNNQRKKTQIMNYLAPRGGVPGGIDLSAPWGGKLDLESLNTELLPSGEQSISFLTHHDANNSLAFTKFGGQGQSAIAPVNMVVNSTINVSGSMNDYAEADLTNHISQAAKEAVESAMAAYRQEDNWARFA